MERHQLIGQIQRASVKLEGSRHDYDELIQAAADKDIVLLGESSHGTREFYDARAYISQRLIEELGFSAVVVEADWPDAYRVNRFVRGDVAIASALDSVSSFQRFPLWMWRNLEVVEFISWMREFNRCARPDAPCGFYGMDLYSLHRSLHAVLEYLEQVDPEAAERARDVYACFEQHGEPAWYGQAVSLGLAQDCEKQVVEQLSRLQRARCAAASQDGLVGEDDQFHAEQNAQLVRNAERYYRELYRAGISSWNLRDAHMVETVQRLRDHLSKRTRRPKLIVWAHNSHLGDARYTSMGTRGEHNVGQLLKEQLDDRVLSVGFTTYRGSVIAASDWDGPTEKKKIVPARQDSYEALFHETAEPAFLLEPKAAPALASPRLQRGLGVIYRPEDELANHYFHASLSHQFDRVVHFDRTTALQPLDTPLRSWSYREPETYPSGI